jgi:hypothetical protein
VGDQHIEPHAMYARLAQHDDPLRLLRDDPIGDETGGIARGRSAARAGAAGAARGHTRTLGRAARRRLGPARDRAALPTAWPATRPGWRTRCCRPGAMAATRSACARRWTRPAAPTRCAGFSAGGGRAGAAGIDHLPAAQLPRFMAELAAARWGG